MNNFEQARRELENVGWRAYLKQFESILKNRRITDGRYFETDDQLQDYIRFNLPLCLGEDVKIEDLLTHENGPTGEERELLTVVIDLYQQLDPEHPYGLVYGEDACYR